MTALLNRIGNLGLLLIASALLLGGLAGAAVVHHYDSLSVASVTSQQHKDKADQKQAKPKSKHAKHKPSNSQHQQGDQAGEATG